MLLLVVKTRPALALRSYVDSFESFCIENKVQGWNARV